MSDKKKNTYRMCWRPLKRPFRLRLRGPFCRFEDRTTDLRFIHSYPFTYENVPSTGNAERHKLELSRVVRNGHILFGEGFISLCPHVSDAFSMRPDDRNGCPSANILAAVSTYGYVKKRNAYDSAQSNRYGRPYEYNNRSTR